MLRRLEQEDHLSPGVLDLAWATVLRGEGRGRKGEGESSTTERENINPKTQPYHKRMQNTPFSLPHSFICSFGGD
jgi:hypothetical protein